MKKLVLTVVLSTATTIALAETYDTTIDQRKSDKAILKRAGYTHISHGEQVQYVCPNNGDDMSIMYHAVNKHRQKIVVTVCEDHSIREASDAPEGD